MNFPTDVLIYDIETATFGNSMQTPEKHVTRVFGAYSYKSNKYYVLKDWKQMQKLIDLHKFCIGFNNHMYDNVVLLKDGFNFKYKIIIDLFKIINQRKMSIKWKGKPLGYHLEKMSLDFITKTLELVNKDSGKGELDYKILNKHPSEWTSIEWRDIVRYTKKDIEITKKLWEWCFKQFDSWKHHLKSEDVRKLRHIYSTPSVYTYKVLCNRAELKEEYSNREGKRTDLKDGGYVSYPAIEKLEGDIYCMDYASVYPHAIIQCNLYGRVQDPSAWHGNNKFKILGYYNNEKMSRRSQVLHEIYKERKELKKQGSDKEHGLKITMNVAYGDMRDPTFKNVYDPVAGNDCCLIAQQWLKLARKRYMEAGYFVFYSDTDSVYLEDKHHNKEKLLEVTKEIIKEIKINVPFPVDTFDMDIDYEIDFIHFFHGGHEKDDADLDEEDIKNKKLGLMKKNYLFVYKKKDGTKDVIIKNLGIVKSSNTKLSKKIFWEKMVPIIKSEHRAKFTQTEITQWIQEYLKQDITLISKRYKVMPKSTYKSLTCIQVQIHNYIPKDKTECLGDGLHFLLPNTKFGIGKGKRKYCTFEEFEKYLKPHDLDTSVVMKELEYFNKDAGQKFKLAAGQTGFGAWF